MFTRENRQNVPLVEDKKSQHPLTSIEITEATVLKVLQKLNPNKSPGPDCIHPKILSVCANELAKPLAIIFHQSLEEGKLPQDSKEANVTPVFKRGTRADVGNHRPISLTAVCCKVMESLVRNSILHHMILNGFLSDYQCGFVQCRSCTAQLLKVVDK